MDTIKNVVFDFGGVLLDWNPRYFYKSIFNDDQKMEYFLQNIATSTWNAQMDKGRSFEECMKELAEQYPEYKDPIMLYRKGWETMLKGPIESGMRVLDAVMNAQKFKVYGLTNWSAETFPGTFNKYKFLQKFEGIVVSGEEQMIKPEKGIYLTLIERYNLVPEETFFMDDNIQNVETALSRGINAVQFTGTDKNLEQIAKILNIKI
ncbi:MAG: HAD family phosphatase [Succinivibrio sp.]|nr:HAD family phosphatase [Succinivibrio sp.]MBQ8477599.1 HAD family phosphatase [Succinivibrio sp.]MCI5639162.1 HAD family phosphatase [Succinivibrio sp.]MCI6449248.1 HAD family phosphatase [Succinivibrio sp.]MDD6067940.1 HAD family phosphatase [Succinivibrio sp.]